MVNSGVSQPNDSTTSSGGLRAYLLGEVSVEVLLALQRRLAYDIGGENGAGALLLWDHPTGITIGREGSRLHVRPGREELQAREWPVRWMSRGGGVMLHQRGQVTCYPILALDRLSLTPAAYIRHLEAIVIELLRDFGVIGTSDPDQPGVRVGTRRVAHIGVAVRGWVCCFGLVINVDPDLEPFRDVACDGDGEPMTSIQREAPTMRVRVAAVRQRLVALIAARFRFDRVSVFHTQPGLFTPATPHAAITASR